jgi:hypothetical protein
MIGLLLLLLLQADSLHIFTTHSYKHRQAVGNVNSREVRTAKTISRLYFDKTTKRELFRIRYGDKLEGEWVSYWTYGLTANGDFNHDGKEDYWWDAGDDTSSQELLILSTPRGYQQIDVYDTLEAAWRLRYKAPAPDLALASNFYNFEFSLESSQAKLTLIAEGTDHDKKTYSFRIPAAEFIPALLPRQSAPRSNPR